MVASARCTAVCVHLLHSCLHALTCNHHWQVLACSSHTLIPQRPQLHTPLMPAGNVYPNRTFGSATRARTCTAAHAAHATMTHVTLESSAWTATRAAAAWGSAQNPQLPGAMQRARPTSAQLHGTAMVELLGCGRRGKLGRLVATWEHPCPCHSANWDSEFLKHVIVMYTSASAAVISVLADILQFSVF